MADEIVKISNKGLKVEYQRTYLYLQRALLTRLYKSTNEEDREKYRQEIKELGESYQSGLAVLKNEKTI